MTGIDWRSIPLDVVDWSACGVSRRASHKIQFMTSPPLRTRFDRAKPEGWPDPDQTYGERGSWCQMTLGDLADRGETWWRRHGYMVGDMAMEVIRRTIDMAAEGKQVRHPGRAPDAYVPQCERGKDA